MVGNPTFAKFWSFLFLTLGLGLGLACSEVEYVKPDNNKFAAANGNAIGTKGSGDAVNNGGPEDATKAGDPGLDHGDNYVNDGKLSFEPIPAKGEKEPDTPYHPDAGESTPGATDGGDADAGDAGDGDKGADSPEVVGPASAKVPKKTVNWGEYVPVYWDVPGASEGKLQVFPMFGDNQTTPVISKNVPADQLPMGTHTIATDQLEPGRYDVTMEAITPNGRFVYHAILTVKPIIELSFVANGNTVIQEGKPFGVNVYLPNGTHGTDLSLDGKVSVNWDMKPVGTHAAEITSDKSGTYELKGTVIVNDVEGDPDTLAVEVYGDCGTPFECIKTKIEELCKMEPEVYSTKVEIPKFSGCNYGVGENLPKVGNQSYRFLVAENHRKEKFSIPEGAVLCGLKTFAAEENVIQRDQLAVTLNDVLFSSAVQDFTSLLPKENGFSIYDWPTLRGNAGFEIAGAVANPPDYCLGMENNDGSCQVPERSQPTHVPGPLTSQVGNPTFQKLFAHFESKNVAHDSYWLGVHAYGDTDDHDCTFKGVTGGEKVSFDIEVYYVMEEEEPGEPAKGE